MNATYKAAENRLWAAQKEGTLSANTPTLLLADLFTPEQLASIQHWYSFLYESYTCNTDAVYSALNRIKTITTELELELA